MGFPEFTSRLIGASTLIISGNILRQKRKVY
jgi:hypothetical protein